MVGLVTHEPGLVINASWMVMVVLSGLIASRCMSLLGISRPIALSVGMLFAFLPYAVIRNINHFSRAIYLIPIPSAAALLVGTGRLSALPRTPRWALGVGCALLGLNYPYYAFFACFLILVASLVNAAAERNYREIGSGLLLVGVICFATVVNLTPSFYAWANHGRPSSIPVKHAAEAEQYGLKIRHLVSPIRDHAFPLFRRWTSLEQRAQYPLEGENATTRLGVIGTIGFLVILRGFFAPKFTAAVSDGALFLGASRLTLASLLLGTIGGFGGLFNLLVAADIRAYNRVMPFIAFFSLVAVALMADRLLANASLKFRRRAAGTLALMLCVGLYDDAQATGPINLEHEAIRVEWANLSSFVRTLEERLPAGAMVF